MLKLAIRIEVDNLRPLTVGVPRLVSALEAQAAGATFLFSVGPDRSGRHLFHLTRKGNAARFWRTRKVRDFGVLTWMRGTLLPAPDLGKRGAELMRSVRDSGFETGVRAFDPQQWYYLAAGQQHAWTEASMRHARSRYEEIFGEPPRVHAAVGWQMNRYAYRLTQRLEFSFSSDTRGTHPFIPVCQGEVVSCPQLPATLPSMDELIGRDGVTPETVVERLLELTRDPPSWGHVFPANAAYEGLALLPQFEQLLRGWRQQGYELLSLRDYVLALDTRELPYHEVTTGFVAGRDAALAMQGKEFLGDS